MRSIYTNFYLKLSVLIFWICNLFGSYNFISDYLSQTNDLSIEIFLGKSSIIPINYLSILILSSILIIKYEHVRIGGYSKKLFYFTILVSILSFLNPNNNFNTINLYKQTIIEFGFFFILYYSLVYLKNEDKNYVLKLIINTGKYVVMFKGGIYIIKYLLGNGMNFGGYQFVILQYDILFWYAIYFGLCYYYFVTERKLIDLIIIIITIIVLMFSKSRSSMIMGILPIIIYHIFVIKNKRSTIIILRNIIFISIFVIFVADLIPGYDLLRKRIMSIYIRIVGGHMIEGEADHLTQSITTTIYMLKHIYQFFGIGITSESALTNYVKGSSYGGVHNTFVYVWAKYGMFMLLYYLYITYTAMKQSRIHWRNRNTEYMFYNIILFSYMLSGWSTGIVKSIFTDHIAISQFIILWMLSTTGYSRLKNE